MRRPRLLSPGYLIRSNAVRKGLLGGSRGWLAVGIVIWSRGFLKKVFGKQEEHLGVEQLEAGQFVRIEAIRPLSRRERRAASKAA